MCLLLGSAYFLPFCRTLFWLASFGSVLFWVATQQSLKRPLKWFWLRPLFAVFSPILLAPYRPESLRSKVWRSALKLGSAHFCSFAARFSYPLRIVLSMQRNCKKGRSFQFFQSKTNSTRTAIPKDSSPDADEIIAELNSKKSGKPARETGFKVTILEFLEKKLSAKNFF